jgi:hypothetical protein
MNNDDDLLNQPLSDDFEENMRMENELLRLKMKAELGGESHSSGDLDPMLANEFLKHVMAFEHNYANSKRVKIFDLLGQPDFKAADQLDDEQVTAELERVLDLLGEKNIDVNFSGEYDDRTKYAFIVDELFEHEKDDFAMEGMTTYFDYEEFHPNHALDIGNRAKEFLEEWFEKKLDEKSWCLDNAFVLSQDVILNKKQVTDKIKTIFDLYGPFTECDYKILDIGFELYEEGGMGHAEGVVKYKGALDNGEQADIRGVFKLYMSLSRGWWSICHIVFPGFEY